LSAAPHGSIMGPVAARPGSTCELAYVEHALPGDARERIELARRLGLALEVADRPQTDLETIASSGLPVATVQAWRLHEVHPLHPDGRARAEALDVVEHAMDVAARLAAKRVLTVCGFGQVRIEAPFERSLEFFLALAPRARARGLSILIEPLSPLRSAHMTSLDDQRRLMAALADEDCFATAFDTGHLLDGGHEPAAVLAAWPHAVEEVQLHAAASEAPSEDTPLEHWIEALPASAQVVAIEHHRPLDSGSLERLIARVRAALAHAGWG
jgi:sugar phosphate isomerase/epimerase